MKKLRVTLKKLLEEQKITPEEYKSLRTRERTKMAAVACLMVWGICLIQLVLPHVKPHHLARMVEVPLETLSKVTVGVKNLVPNPRVVSFYPEGEVDDLDNMVVLFSSPMVTDTMLNIIVKDLPAQIEPDLGAQFLWISPTTLKIVIDRLPPPGTTVKFAFGDAMKDFRGNTLYFSRNFSFLYRPLCLRDVHLQEEEVVKDGVPFAMRFNVDVPASELKKYLTVLDENKNAVPFHLANELAVSQTHAVRLDIPSLSKKKLTFLVKAGIKAHQAERPIEDDLRWEFGTFDELMIQNIQPGRVGYSEYSEDEGEEEYVPPTQSVQPSIRVSFNRNIKNIEGLKEFITVNDDTDFKMNKDGSSGILLTSDKIQFGETCVVVCHKGMRSGVYEMSVDVVRQVVIPAARPALALKTSGVFQSRQGQWLLPIEHVNVDTLYMAIYQIYDNNLVYFATQYEYAINHDPLFFKVKDVAYRLTGAKNGMRTDHLDLRAVLQGHEWGPKILQFSTNRHSFLDHRLLIMTDLGISFKQVGQTMVVLVTSLKDAKPIADATVEIFSRSNQILATGSTNSDGVAKFKRVSLEHGVPQAIVVKKEKDVSYLAIQRGLLPTTGFDIDGDPYPSDSQMEAAVYGEREIYRPGETAKLKILVRGKDISLLPSIPVQVWATAPDGRKIWERTVRFDSLGLADIQIPIAEQSLSGKYQVSISIPGRNAPIGSTTLQIESFVPDRIEVHVASDVKEAKLGQAAKFSVQGKYLFGAPAEGHRVQAMYTMTPVPFAPAAYADYRFGDGDIAFQDMLSELNESKLDEHGASEYSVTVPEGLRPAASLKLTFTATVLDVGARGVSARQELTVYPYPFYIGLKPTTDNLRDVPYGSSVDFKIVAVTPDGKPVDKKTLKVKFFRREWEYAYRADEHGNYRHVWEKQNALVSESETKLDNGMGQASFKVTGWGQFVLEVSDEDSRVKSSLVFASGWDWESQVSRKLDFDRLEVKLDKETYRPGQTAKVHIAAPFDGVAYVFLEGTDIQFYRPVSVVKRKAALDIPVQRSWAPNIYVSVILLSGSQQAKFGQTRAVGVSPLKILADDKILDVELDAPADPSPGTEQSVTIRVKDQAGLPVNGEVALSIVDQGVLQLSPLSFVQPYDHFYRKRANQVSNADLFSYINPEPETKVARRLVPAGDEWMRRHRMPFRIASAVPVSEWHPRLKVEGGQVNFKWKVPDFSGKLVFRAWATAAEGVGYEKVERELKQPLILEASLPRAVTPGDTFYTSLKLISNLKEGTPIGVRISGDTLLRVALDTNIFLKPGESADIQAAASVGIGFGAGEMSVRLSYLSKQVNKTFTTAVRPPYPVVTESAFHVIRAGTPFELKPEDRYIRGTDRHRLIITRMPDAGLLAGLDYLIRYPYGCIEQTTSSVFPQLFLKHILKFVDKRFSRDEEIDRNINQGISRLMTMLHADGGFSYWPGEGDVYPYGTVYAAHFLFEAKRAGYAVPESQLAVIKEYLQKLAESYTADISVRSYATYVLALAGSYNTPLARKLMPQAEGPYKYYLVGAIVLSGEENIVADYLRTKTPPQFSGRSTHGVLSSDVVSDAIVLSALLEADRQSPMAESLVESLLKKARYSGRWGSTHDNAYALVALGKYYMKKSMSEDQFFGVVLIDGKERLTFDSRMDTCIDIDQPVRSIQIRSGGTGNFHFVDVTSGIPNESHQMYFQNGVEVKRAYYDLKGDLYPSDKFVHGQLYVVEAKIKPHQGVGNLFLEDILPGGMEAENPRLSTRVQDVPFLEEGVARPEHADFKDDRVILFFNSLPYGSEMTFRYMVRAVTRGVFVQPALQAGCMYDPDIQCVQPGRFIIVE